MANLRDRNVLITGGASGLGLGFVHAFAKSGSRVIIADFNDQAGIAVEQKLREEHCNVTFVKVDVTSIASVAAMVRAALEWIPQGEAIDAAILSAGVNGNPFDLEPGDPSELADTESLQTVERSAATLNVNLTAVLQCVQLIVKYGMGISAITPSNSPDTIMPATAKSIALIGSVGSYRALPRAVDYSASKWGLRGAFRSLRQQLPKIGVRVNLIAPGFVKTPLLAATVPMYEQLGVHFADEVDVVEAVVKTISDLTCSGKAFAVTSQGIVELRDTASGMDASTVLNDLVGKGALGKSGCPMGHDEQTIEFK